MSRITRVAPFILLCVSVTAGCSHAEGIITCAASKEMKCPKESIQVNSLGANQYTVTGCGKKINISCKGPTDGCLINETLKPFNIYQCLK